MLPTTTHCNSFFFKVTYLFSIHWVFDAVQFSSVAQSSPTLCYPMECSTPGLPAHHELPEFTQTYVHLVNDATQPSHPLSSPSPPVLNLSSIMVFSNESALHIRWPKDWSFSFSISPSNGYSGLISFRMDWLDLLAVQGTLKGLLQHHSSKPSILQRSLLEVKDGKMALGIGHAHTHTQTPTGLPQTLHTAR